MQVTGDQGEGERHPLGNIHSGWSEPLALWKTTTVKVTYGAESQSPAGL